MRFNNRNGQSSRVSSPASYAGTPWSRRVPTTCILASSSPGHGVGASGTTRLNLPIANIIECNGNLISIMSNAAKATQDPKNQLLSTYEGDPFSVLPMKFSVSLVKTLWKKKKKTLWTKKNKITEIFTDLVGMLRGLTLAIVACALCASLSVASPEELSATQQVWRTAIARITCTQTERDRCRTYTVCAGKSSLNVMR